MPLDGKIDEKACGTGQVETWKTSHIGLQIDA